MTSEMKIFGGIGLVTLLLIVGGVVMFSRTTSNTTEIASEELLVTSDSHKIATDSAKLTIVEFGDFQCPACGAAYAPVKALVAKNSTAVNFVWRNFPLTIHKNAQMAAEAAEAAGDQGKYWQMHDLLFSRQSDWAELKDPKNTFIEYATSLELDPHKFTDALDSHQFLPRIQNDLRDGNQLGVNATPTFFVNGEKLVGSPDDLTKLVNAKLATP